LKPQKQLFNQLFQKNVKKFKGQRNGKNIDSSLICTEPKLDRYIKKQYSKYKKGSYNNFFTECMLLSWEAIQKFDILDDGNWRGILDRTDKKNFNRVISYIKTTIKFDVIKKVNPKLKYTTAKIGGEREHVAYKIEPSSLEVPIYESADSVIQLKDIINQDSDFWANKSYTEDYRYTHFINWYEENKEDILIDSQLELLKNLQKANLVEGYSPKDVEDITGVPSNKINTRLKRIERRILKVWEKENPLGEKTFQDVRRENEINLWEEFIEIMMDQDNLEIQNKKLTVWIQKNSYREEIIKLTEVLEKEELITFNKYINYSEIGEIPVEILSKLVIAIEKRIKTLKMPYITKNEKKEHKKSNKFEEWEERQKELKNQPVYVYNKDRELIRIVTGYNKKKKGTYIINITPTGTHEIID